MSDVPFPFDLPGPQFLVFFILFAALLLFILRRLSGQGADGDPVQVQASDPYRFAYLRGGAAEVLRLAAFALAERGFLSLDGQTAKAKNAHKFRTNLPLETRALQHFSTPRRIDRVDKSEVYDWADRHYRSELQRLDLVPGEAELRVQQLRRNIGWLLLIGLAGIKIAVALMTGHTNILFLVVLTAIALWLVARVTTRSHLTARGRRVLADMQSLFSGLRQRGEQIRPGSGTAEAVLLAAVFGFAALPAGFSGVADLYGAGRRGDGGSSSSDSGSGGCGSSSSGCGGGGGDSGGGGGGCGS